MNARRGVGVVAVVLALAAVGWLLTRPDGAEAGTLSASGTVEATDADLGFQAAGRIAELTAREGDAVQAGDELARLDARELSASVDAARAAVDASRARLTELRAGARTQEVATAQAARQAAADRLADARRDEERARTLFEGGAVSRQTLDRATTALDIATASDTQAAEQLALVREGPRVETIRAQQAAVDQASANLARAEATIANSVIEAPFAGVVTLRHREPGETVVPGAPVLTLLDRDDRWVRIYVQEDRIGRVRIGQAATIRSDSYPDRTYEGEVVFIGSEAEFTPRNVQTAEQRTKLVYPVKVRITGDPSFELKPGIPADVTLRETPG